MWKGYALENVCGVREFDMVEEVLNLKKSMNFVKFNKKHTSMSTPKLFIILGFEPNLLKYFNIF